MIAGELGRKEGVDLCFHGKGTEGFAVDGYVEGAAAEGNDVYGEPGYCGTLCFISECKKETTRGGIYL